MRRFLLLAAAAAAFGQSIPRPEYPEPQFQRERWENLNGRWEFDFDDSNAGLREHWESAQRKFSRSILVPFCFESRSSGIGDTSFHPWAWYRRGFTIPEAWRGHRVLLHFGAVDYHAMVWVNGQMTGEHEGGNVPFQFDITNLLKPGANMVTVRAEDPPTDRYIPRGKQYWEPKSKSIFYTRTSGIWQTVWLEPIGQSYVQNVHITPSNSGEVRFDARIAGPDPTLLFRVRVNRGGRMLATSTVTADEPRVTASVFIANPALWSPEHPELYDVEFELVRQGPEDHVKSYFGFRSVATENGRVALNGRPIYLRMVLDQGYWPESILTPPSEDAIQYDIRLTKEMGFNGARKHQKLEDPRYLYWADKMGLLVSSEMANAYLFDTQAVERFTREWMAAVERDYNHPSIVIWVPINESWGVPNLRDARQPNYLRELYAITHSLDATRLVIDNEGWEHTDMTDLFAIHDYAKTGDKLLDKYKDLGKPGARIPDVGRPPLAPGYQYNGTPVYLSEFGGIAFIPAGHQAPEESWGYAGVEKTADSAVARFRGLYEGIARIPAFAGLCYTQLTDVEQEVNGLMTYDRKPKFDVAEIRRINLLVQ